MTYCDEHVETQFSLKNLRLRLMLCLRINLAQAYSIKVVWVGKSVEKDMGKIEN